MSDDIATPQTLKQMLEERGLDIVAVTSKADDPEQAVVYLHGPSGQWAAGAALNTISRIPGVLHATEDEQTASIVVVRLRPTQPVPDKRGYRRPTRRRRPA